MRRATLALLLLALLATPCRGQTPELLASWPGQDAGEQFGIALALGGDANGDGWADLAVGASTADVGGQNSGRVAVYLGGGAPGASPDLVLVGPAGSFFGAALAWVGDVNADGYEDLLVGAFRDSTDGPFSGRAYLYYGGPAMDDVPDLVLTGPGAGAYFGRAVAGLGDVDGDGHPDFAVGAPRTPRGDVFVYFGGPGLDATADLVLQGPEDGCRFGAALAGGADMDGIPGDDILVGAPRLSTSHLWAGGVLLLSGGSALDAIPDWIVHGLAAGDELGTSVACAGDVNGDGAADIVCGAPYANAGSLTDAGAAYVFFGGASLDTIADFTFVGSAEEAYVGRSVAGCGDVTGSGFGHVAFGAPGDGGSGTVWLCPGGDPPVPGDVIALTGEAAGDQFGYAVSGMPGRSFAGDPRADLAAGAWSHDPAGKAYVFGYQGSSAVEGALGPVALGVVVAPNPSTAFLIRPRGPVPAGTRLEILTPAGRRVWSGLLDPAGLRWEGYDARGRRLPAGLYLVRVAGSDGPARTARLLLLR
jgi:hypothetical protein